MRYQLDYYPVCCGTTFRPEGKLGIDTLYHPTIERACEIIRDKYSSWKVSDEMMKSLSTLDPGNKDNDLSELFISSNNEIHLRKDFPKLRLVNNHSVHQLCLFSLNLSLDMMPDVSLPFDYRHVYEFE